LDGTGADFILLNANSAKKMFIGLSSHKKIKQMFNIKWDGTSRIINIFYKNKK